MALTSSALIHPLAALSGNRGSGATASSRNALPLNESEPMTGISQYMRNTLIVFTLLFVSACSHTPIHNYHVEEIKKFNNMLQREMIQAFGKPDYEESLPLSKARDEMRGPLQKHFPKKFRNNPNIIIRELWWQDGDFYLTSWFKMKGNDWVVFESLRWHKDVRF